MFKIALSAGHGLNTAGKRCMKKLDANETREWVLNSRICDRVEQKLTEYDGYQLIRTDDKSGKSDISIKQRAKKANDFAADIYISVHHNAGIKGKTGGGIVAYVYTKVDNYTLKMQKLLYDKLIAKTGLKGNRAMPLAKANLGECRLTKMPAVLLECGFMDSPTDVPVILSDSFADKAAQAITEAIVQLGSLKKKAVTKMYYVQVGAYKNKGNAEQTVKELKKAGFNAIIKAQ